MNKIIKSLEVIKFVYLISFSTIIPLQLYSVPAIKTHITVTQNDNTKITLSLVGDEYAHYYCTSDSIPVFKVNDTFYYGSLNNGQLIISDKIAHEKHQRTIDENKFLSKQDDVINYINESRNRLKNFENEHRTSKNKRNLLEGNCQYIGSKRGLVVLVEFSDLTFTSESANKDFYKMFNQPGYSLNGSIGSVRDYFIDQSYGNFNLSFDIIGPVTLSNNYSYYGANSIITGQDSRVYDMVIEACQLIDSEIDFSIYDWDGDGEVEQVFFIYAGYGEHAGASSNTIWPHESQLSSKKLHLDGVDINTYACSCELRGTTGTVLNGIGTPCHEFSHCLGLPDFYDTDYSGAFGMSYWDVMNSGSHSGPSGWGEIPYGYSAYERWYAGWLEPIEITDTQENIEIRDIGLYPEAIIIYNEGNRNEYYLLENHQSDRWFQYVGTNIDMHGLMVTHVDYDKKAWKNNIVNPNSSHQRMSIIPADNKYGESEEDLRGDLYPGITNTTTLTYSSHQDTGGKLFNRNIDGSYNMNLSLTAIKEENKIINFDIVNTANFPIPQVVEATEISTDGYTANWIELPEAEGYIIEQISTVVWNSILPVTKKQTLEVSTQTSCTMNWLIDDCDAKYRVKGIIKGIPTEWSEFISVGNPSSIKIITSDNETNICDYYTLDGIMHNVPTRGINIIIQGNKSKKILNKR